MKKQTFFILLVLFLTFSLQANEKRKEIDVVYSKLSSALPADSQLIASPYPENLGTYGNGLQQEIKMANDMIGGQVLQVSATKKRNVYDQGVILPITAPVKKGDVLYLTFFAKAITPPSGKDTVTIQGVGVQQNAEPYGSVFANNVTLSTQLQSFTYAGRANQDYAAGELQVTFQVANGKQDIAFGPVFIYNVGNTPMTALPYLGK
jgi:hypothetical protein